MPFLVGQVPHNDSKSGCPKQHETSQNDPQAFTQRKSTGQHQKSEYSDREDCQASGDASEQHIVKPANGISQEMARVSCVEQGTGLRDRHDVCRAKTWTMRRP